MPVELSVETRGPREGLPVVLLHGFPLDRGMWRAQAAPLAEAGHMVLLPDLRGHGRSPVGEGPATMEAMAEDVLAALDRLGIAGFVACGLSMGGYVAFELLRQAPERVEALVLADTRAEADAPGAREGRHETARRVRAEGPAVLAETMLPKLLGAGTAARDPALVEETRGMILRQRAEGLAQALEGMARRRDARPMLPDVHVPTLVLVGAQDAVTPPDVARGMRDALPRARLEVLPQAGHLSPLEAPHAFNAALLGWLRDEVAPRRRATRAGGT